MKQARLFSHLITRNGRSFYEHLYPIRIATEMCGPYPVVEVLVEEVEVATDDTYWAWWSNERNALSLIYKDRRQVEMCFPGSIEYLEEKGHGKCLPVRITEVVP